MEIELIGVVTETLKTAGGYGTAGLFVWLFWRERQRNDTHAERVLSIALKGAETTQTQTQTILSLKEAIDDLTDAVRRIEP